MCRPYVLTGCQNRLFIPNVRNPRGKFVKDQHFVYEIALKMCFSKVFKKDTCFTVKIIYDIETCVTVQKININSSLINFFRSLP